MGAPGVAGGLSDCITAVDPRPRGARLRRRGRPVVDRSVGPAAVLQGSRSRACGFRANQSRLLGWPGLTLTLRQPCRIGS